jgi:hypothetical protein
MGNEEVGVGGPGVDGEALLLADALDVFPVEDFEGESEAAVEFGLPLVEHGRGAGDDDVLDPLAEKELGGDEAGFDGFAEADVIGDEEVHPGEAEGLVEGFELVSVELDASAEGRLKEVGVGGCDAVPAESVEEGGEVFPGVEALATNRVPALLGDDPWGELCFP